MAVCVGVVFVAGQWVCTCEHSRAQASGAGQTGIQGPSTGTTECLNINYWTDSPFTAVYVFGCIFCSQAFTLIRQDQAGPVTSASLSAVVLVPVVIHHINVQPHSPVHARLYDEHTHLWRAHTQLCC